MTRANLVAMMSAASLASVALAQSEPPKESPAPAAPPAGSEQAPKPAPPGREPDLDELLGLGKTSAAGNTGIPDPGKAELDKRLAQEQVDDLFLQAVALMGDISKRLGSAVEAGRAKRADGGVKSPQAGLATQRLQQDAVRKLDALIAQLEQQQQQQSSSSRSRQQENDPNQPQRQQRSQARQQQREQRGGNGQRENDPPAGQSGDLRPELEAARAAWGALPERVRDMLQQGSGDRYSSLYERLTSDYYKRLAEQGRTRGGASGGRGERP